MRNFKIVHHSLQIAQTDKLHATSSLSTNTITLLQQS